MSRSDDNFAVLEGYEMLAEERLEDARNEAVVIRREMREGGKV